MGKNIEIETKGKYGKKYTNCETKREREKTGKD